MVNYLDPVRCCTYLKQQINQIHFSFRRGEFVMSKHNNFWQNMLAQTKRQRNRNSVFVLVLISLMLSLKAYMLELDGKDVLNECLPLFLSLMLTLSKYVLLKQRFFVFYASIDVKFYDFYTCQYAFFVILEKILSLIVV